MNRRLWIVLSIICVVVILTNAVWRWTMVLSGRVKVIAATS